MRYRPQIFTILVSSATFVALWLAEALRAAAVPQIYVVFVGFVMSAFVALVLVTDLLLSRLERMKR
jgi:hypothetical protein